MAEQDQTNTLIKGTAILAFAALFTKIIGVLYRIPYQNITGDTGLGVYAQVYPVYTILLTLATAGIPVAVSKMVAERLALNDTAGAKKIFQVSAVTLSCTGLFFFIIMFAGAPFIARLMTLSDPNPELTLPIRSVAFALLIVPVMATIRGYYQGHQYMVPTAISQVFEQIVRVGTILLLAIVLYPRFGAYYAGAGAVFGAFTGALAAFAVLLFFWRKVVRKQQEGREGTEKVKRSEGVREGEGAAQTDIPLQSSDSYQQHSFYTIMKKVAAYAIPISLGSMVIPLFQLVDSFSIPNALMWAGWPGDVAIDARGTFDRGQPLVQFGAFFATALALALVPSISDAQARADHALIARRSQLAVKLTFVIGLASAIGLFVLAHPINRMFYRVVEGSLLTYIPDNGSGAISVLAFVIIFTTLNITSAAILQGLGHVLIPARNLLIGVGVKVIGNLVLIPVWDISGAALASVIGYAVATILNLWFIHRTVRLALSKVFLMKPLVAVSVMAGSVWLTKTGVSAALSTFMDETRLYFTIVSLSAVMVGMIVYLAALLRSEAITRRELAVIPKVHRLLPWLERLGLVKAKS